MRKILFSSAAIMALATATLATPVSAETLTPEQKKEVEKIVRQYLLDNPEILVEVSRRLEEKRNAQRAALEKAGLKAHADLIFNNPADPTLGDTGAKVAVVEFFDYNCGFCRRALKDMQKLVNAHKDVKVVFKEFPILGPGSDEAARIALAAKMQDEKKYWELHQALLNFPGRVNGDVALKVAGKLGYDVEKLKKDKDSDAVKSIIATNLQLADALGINGTPAFIIGDQVIRGALGYAALEAAVKAARDNDGKKG